MTEQFNQKKYVYDWTKENMKSVGSKYKADFVDQFKQACKELGLVQSQVFKQAMQDVIDQAKANK